MEILWVFLIVVGAFILLGPIMFFFAKINKVDPYIFEKNEEDAFKDEKSIVIVGILKPLFVPLWVETKLLKWVGLIKK